MTLKKKEMEIKAGEWIKCDEGSMPEDLFPVIDYGNGMPGDVLITETVLIPFKWSDDYGHAGDYYPAYRWKLRGNKHWKWSVVTAKPLVWMRIPKMPGSDEFDRQGVRRIIQRYNLELFEERNLYTYVFSSVTYGDWVRCMECGRKMLVPTGEDECPFCRKGGTLAWVDDEKKEMDMDCVGPTRSAGWIAFVGYNQFERR